MNLNEYIASLKGPILKATVIFLIKDEYILLGHKKRGFGQNKWNGVGGKVEKGESVEDSAVRETEEEIGIKIAVNDLEQVAILHFYFPEMPVESNYNQEVYAYFVQWKKEMGKPSESEEIYPKWFKRTALPFDMMWDDDKVWLPKALAGERFEANFGYTADPKTGVLKVDTFQFMHQKS